MCACPSKCLKTLKTNSYSQCFWKKGKKEDGSEEGGWREVTLIGCHLGKGHRPVVLQPYQRLSKSESPGSLVKSWLLGPPESERAGVGRSQRTHISSKFPDDADGAVASVLLWERLCCGSVHPPPLSSRWKLSITSGDWGARPCLTFRVGAPLPNQLPQMFQFNNITCWRRRTRSLNYQPVFISASAGKC